eukprot:maker-scaffold34_size539781-snap-gene-1.9 protein:Tk05354 transcript:maker-scaffold34_size539781-snap-gene-1.9-mRNA-1 annotation:"hypothetical protein DAPPUDRAFT_306990"
MEGCLSLLRVSALPHCTITILGVTINIKFSLAPHIATLARCPQRRDEDLDWLQEEGQREDVRPALKGRHPQPQWHLRQVNCRGGVEGSHEWGMYVARHPILVIVVSLLITSLSGLGFLRFSSESRAEKLWIPSDSPYLENKAWLDKNYPQTRRNHLALFVAEKNILTPEGIMEMLIMHQKIHAISVNNKTYQDLCFKLPIANIFLTKRRRRRQAEDNSVSTLNPLNSTSAIVPALASSSNDSSGAGTNSSSPSNATSSEAEESSNREEKFLFNFGDDPSDDPQDTLSPQIYCDLVSTLDEKCLENSLLEIWRYSESRVKRLTQEEILYAVNQVAESPWFGYRTDFSVYLGAIERNSSGHIVAAKSALYSWTAAFDPDGELYEEGGVGVELDLADKVSLDFEKEMIEVLLDGSKESEERSGVKIYANVARSFNDITSEAIFFDAVKMAAGYFLMFFYTMLFLGKLNLVEHRTWIAAGGIISVGMGLGIAFGVTSALGMPYTPIHGILPFLALGIGIDDMFVIVQCWYNLSPEEQQRTLPEKIGLTMKHAGVAITVTSLTDVFAFGVGAVTILPGLQAFCVTCAIAIAAIYILQASWFVALLSLDQRRIRDHRDGFAPCIRYRNWIPSAWTQKEYGKMFMAGFAKILKKGFTKIVVLGITLGVFGTGIYGTYLIRQEFDPVLLLPAQSYLRQWLAVQEVHFPTNGWGANIYTGPLEDIENDLEQFEKLSLEMDALTKDGKILKSYDSWWVPFKTFIETKRNVTDWRTMVREGNFEMFLSDFLFSKVGSRYKPKIILEKELVCNQPASRITATNSDFSYVKFSGPEEHVPGRRLVENLIQGKKFSSKAFSFSKVYAAWETDEVISFELWRNLALAMVCVFIITLVLLANVKICLMVLSCICLTLVDMVGFLHFWGLTIDTISCINIVLAIGLCVDYSAHIAHAFIVEEGDREERAMNSLVSMGPAILNGGITTFLALVLLGFSESHAFITFFKVFMLTVIFGLFHGLVYLPVILSLMGPTSSHDEDAASTAGGSSINTNSTNEDNYKPSPLSAGLMNEGYVEDELPKGVGRKLSLLGGRNKVSWNLRHTKAGEMSEDSDPGEVQPGSPVYTLTTDQPM